MNAPYGIPSTAPNRALSAALIRRVKAASAQIAASVWMQRMIGLGVFCCLFGIGLGAAFWGYSYITRQTTSLPLVAEALTEALNRVTLHVDGKVPLDTKDARVRLDASGATVVLDTRGGGTAATIGGPTIESMRPSDQQLGDTTPTPNLITDFTIFKHAKFAEGEIVTGWAFRSNKDQGPYHQYCYYKAAMQNHLAAIFDLGEEGKATTPPSGLPIDANEGLAKCVWYQDVTRTGSSTGRRT